MEAIDVYDKMQKKVLSLGLVCLDIIKVVTDFPREDTDQRFLQSDFEEYGVKFTHCPVYTEMASPVSVVILNSKNGSRTILHTNKNLPELSFDDFHKIDIKSGCYSWIHFEGRPNVLEIKKMLLYLGKHNDNCDESERIITSLEIEKPARYKELSCLMELADYIFISKEVAHGLGLCDMVSGVSALVNKCRLGGAVICPWGEKGAAAHRKGESVVIAPASSPGIVVDTIGAGDTFIGAAIFALNQGKELEESVRFACKVAGAKCGMMGNQGLREMAFS